MSTLHKTQNPLLVPYLIFAIFLIIEGANYLSSPYVGRISILDCRHKVEQRSLCTATIVGFKETAQRSFWVEDFRFAKRITNFDEGISSKATSGVAIFAFNEPTGRTERIDLTHAYQGHGKAAQKTVDRINQVAAEKGSLSGCFIIHVGFNISLYLRLLLLVGGLLFTIAYQNNRNPFEKTS